MTHEHVNYHDVEPIAGSMHFLREPLDCDSLGLTVVECDPGWAGKPHDHAEDGHEEVYLLLEGEATIEVEGEPVDLVPGDALRVSPAATRRVENGETESTLVIAGAP